MTARRPRWRTSRFARAARPSSTTPQTVDSTRRRPRVPTAARSSPAQASLKRWLGCEREASWLSRVWAATSCSVGPISMKWSGGCARESMLKPSRSPSWSRPSTPRGGSWTSTRSKALRSRTQRRRSCWLAPVPRRGSLLRLRRRRASWVSCCLPPASTRYWRAMSARRSCARAATGRTSRSSSQTTRPPRPLVMSLISSFLTIG